MDENDNHLNCNNAENRSNTHRDKWLQQSPPITGQLFCSAQLHRRLKPQAARQKQEILNF